MFGRRSQPQRLRLPDLDPQVTAHWNRGIAPSNPPSAENSSGESLEFVPTPLGATRTKEHRRKRRRLVLSLWMGLLLGPIFVAAYQSPDSREKHWP